MTRPHRRLTELRKLLRHYASRDNDRAREDAATIAWAMGCVEALEFYADDETWSQSPTSSTYGAHCDIGTVARGALGRPIDDRDVSELVKESA